MSSKEYFDGISDCWDAVRQTFFSEVIREKMCEAAQVEPGKLAADLGAGTGFVTEELIARGLNVIAIDQSQEMLDVLSEKFSSTGQITCFQGDAYSLPLLDNRVDYAMANMYLHHIEKPGAAIREMARILKRGGKLVIADLDQHEYEFLRVEQHDVWLGFDRCDIRNWMESAGLKNVTVDCAGEDCSSDSKCTCDQASISIFIACAEKQ